MKQPSRKSLVKRLDAVFSLFIRERDQYVCFVCGKRGEPKDGIMQCGHLFTRAAYATRWDEESCFCQCREDNLRHEYDPNAFIIKFIQKFGGMKYETLYAKHKKPFKISNHEIQVLIQYYEQRVKDLSG